MKDLNDDRNPQAQPTPAQPEEASSRPGGELFEWLQMMMVCILGAVILFNCFARLTRVDGSSMDPTLDHGEMMVVWGLGYQPEQGDIVVVNDTTAEFLGGPDGKAIVKRVIALGGQTVDVDYTNSVVYVDGVPLDEPYTNGPMYNTGDYYMQNTHWEVPEGSIFVMGDNRNHSTDSRHDLLGPVDEDYLLGKAVLALWPISRFGFL